LIQAVGITAFHSLEAEMIHSLRLFFAAAGIAAVAGTLTPPPQALAAPEPARPERPQRRLAAPTPEAIQGYAEEVAGDRFGPQAVAQASAALGSIIAVAVPGRFNGGGPRVNVATRGDGGWSGWGGGGPSPLPAEVSAEIDRLLAAPAFRAEPDRYPEMDCPDSGASLMVIRERGQVRTTRQSCMPANQIGRLLRTVLDERVQPAG
jgi:hypothetical protein